MSVEASGLTGRRDRYQVGEMGSLMHMVSLFLPSEFSITLGLFDSMTATQELVVPRSIPMTLQ